MTHRWSETFGKEAWEWIVKLGNSFSDPEQKKDFWETVKNKKLADPAYDVFADFPKEAPSIEGMTDKERVARKYCGPILEMLKHGRPREEMPKTEPEDSKHLLDLIDKGMHLDEKERKKRGLSA